ncbi:MAG TPA: DUF4340 domain-containing protein [Planctomycetota bacterium]|nr:DUF4340 domain-containing protein [Planctomycetota bacterium]
MNLAKQNLVLGIAAILLAVPTWLQLTSEAESFKDIARIPLLFDGFTSDNVGQILLGQPKKEQPPPDPQNPDQKRPTAYDQLHIVKTDKGFVFGNLVAGDLVGAPVSKERVEADVFVHLRAIRIDRDVLVQPNATPEQLVTFGLDEAQAFVIKAVDATGQNVVAEVLVGKDASAGQTGTEMVRGVFVRKRDSNDVVLYEFDKGWRRDVQQDQWLDKVLARPEPEKVRRLSIRNAATAGTTFTFERKDNKASWTAVEPPADVGALRQSEVESLLQRLRWIAVQDYRLPLQRAGNLQALGLVPPQIEIVLALRDGELDREIKLSVGGKVEGKNEFYLHSSESAFLMTWPAGTVMSFELDVKAQLFDPVQPTEGVKPGEDKKPGEVKKDDKAGEVKKDEKPGEVKKDEKKGEVKKDEKKGENKEVKKTGG